MKRLNDYIIQFSSYPLGSHEFEFKLLDAFFAHFPEGDIRQAEVSVHVLMNRSERQLEFAFDVEGWVLLPCDRCLGDYRQEISGEFELYGKFGEGNSEDELDVVWIAADESQVDLMQYLYEFVVLSLPLRKVHPDLPGGKSGCDPEMLKLLDRLSVK